MNKRGRGVGYFDTFFSDVEIDIIAEALKRFSLEGQVTEANSTGEVLNNFIATIIRIVDYENYKVLEKQLFSYPDRYQETLEVTALDINQEELNHLKNNIDYLLHKQQKE